MRDEAGNGGARQVAVVALARDLRPGAVSIMTERMTSGVSTEVYRVQADDETLYARVLPEEGAHLAPEALAHRLLRAQGVRAPQVVYLNEHNPVLGRAVMVTRAIPGQPLTTAAPPEALPAILAEAGRDLARINSVAVRGFGWVRRDAGAGDELVGEHSRYGDWAFAGLDAAVGGLTAARLLAEHEASLLLRLLDDREAWPAPAEARLAHGDFDCTHVFHDKGCYSGIIDFGEIRGTEPTYDLGQFRIEHPDLLPHLLAGYAQVTPLPPDHTHLIERSAMLIALRRLFRRLETGRDPLPQDLRAVREGIAR